MHIAMFAGCDFANDQIITENPEVRGYVFTRRNDVPLLEIMEPEGGKH
jgi:hypothetical protein